MTAGSALAGLDLHSLEDLIQPGLRVIEEDETAVEAGRVVVVVFLVEAGRAKRLRFVSVAGERAAEVVVAAEAAAIRRRRGAPAPRQTGSMIPAGRFSAPSKTTR